jgi:hypothetical protein
MSKYKYQKKQNETAEVTVPSGNVFLFQRPSKYAVLFNMKALPQAITNKAIESWQEQGIGSEVEDVVAGASKEDRLRLMEMSLKVRDDVLRLSVEPKIVMGSAENDSQLSVDDISDEDLDYLFKWVASGGIAAVGVADFRRGPKQDALASNGGKAKRSKAVEAGGVAG